MSSRTQTRRKTRKSSGLEVNTEAVRILRTLRDEEAFYFYEAVGKPTGEIARSLSDFLKKVKSVKLESLLFHVQRRDFQNWISKTLGDSKLAKRIGRIPPSCNDELRTKIQATIENRIKELSEASVTLLIDERLAVAPSNSTSSNRKY